MTNFDDQFPRSYRIHSVERLRLVNQFVESMRERLMVRSEEDLYNRRITILAEGFAHVVRGQPIKVSLVRPSDWWQAFKHRWFPKWLLRRYPVTHETLTFEGEVYAAICPHIDQRDNRDHLEFLCQHDPGAHCA